MKRIRQIIICGEKWRYELHKNIPDDDCPSGNLGECHHSKSVIKVKESERMKDTPLHEIMEAVTRINGNDYECARGGYEPKALYVFDHGQFTTLVRETWGALRQIYEVRERK